MSKILLLALDSGIKSHILYDENLAEFKSRNRLWNTPNLGLLTVGRIVSEQYEVEYIDLNYETLEKIDYEYEYVFMSPSTSQALRAYQLADLFHSKHIKVVMGGPHVSMMADEALQHADAVFIGESEETMVEFLADPNRRIYEATIRPDLIKSPIPLYELTQKYAYSSIPIQLSRGCPHQCGFCLSSKIYGKQIRRKSIEQVKQELFYIKEIYPNAFLFFTDDNFLIHQEYALQVLEILEKLHLHWYAFTDISIYQKPKLLHKLYQSGCQKLLIGFESLNEENLIELNKSGFKSSKRKAYEAAINTIQSERIGVVGSFVLGLPKDTVDTFDQLYDFIYETCIYGTNITIATPFPGTRFYQEVLNRQDLSLDWSLYDGFTLLYDIPYMTKDQFMKKYIELIQRINSKERIERVYEFFRR